MAKGILEFDLNEPDDATAHKRAVKALDLCLALLDIEQEFRKQIRYNESLTEEAIESLNNMRESYYDIKSKYNIDLDELVN